VNRCRACDAYDAAERATIEGREMPAHSVARDACSCEAEPTLALTLLGPERLPLSPQRGTTLDVTWSELIRWISHPVVTTDKASAGGFVLARLRDGIRRKANVEAVSALAFDHDAGTMTPQTAHERLHRYRHVVYSTWTSPDRWRAIIAISRPMTTDEHAIVWAACACIIERDAPLDPACKDPCRLWYTPAIPPGREHILYTGDGEPVDVDLMLAQRAARPSNAHRYVPSGASDKYITIAIEKECAAVLSAGVGGRNLTLNKAAYSLSRLNVSSVEIERALFDAAVRAGLPKGEALKTIRSALRARRGQS
jgi:hypothetical protein